MTIFKWKEQFRVKSEERGVDGKIKWRVLINDMESFLANFGSYPPGVTYEIEELDDHTK